MNRYRTARSFRSKSQAMTTDSDLAQEAQSDLISSLFLRSETKARKSATLHRDGVDVCPYLFERCKEWQRDFMDGAGLTCLFDVDSGHLDDSLCKTLAGLVQNRMRSVATAAVGPGGTITLTLRNRGSLWALASSDQFVRHRGPRLNQVELSVMRALATKIEGAYVIQAIDGGSLVAVLFSETPGILSPAALAQNRAQFRQ